jgi:hypothetical protein
MQQKERIRPAAHQVGGGSMSDSIRLPAVASRVIGCRGPSRSRSASAQRRSLLAARSVSGHLLIERGVDTAGQRVRMCLTTDAAEGGQGAAGQGQRRASLVDAGEIIR